MELKQQVPHQRESMLCTPCFKQHRRITYMLAQAVLTDELCSLLSLVPSELCRTPVPAQLCVAMLAVCGGR